MTVHPLTRATIRRANPDEVGKVAAFIVPFIEDGRILPRADDELEELIDTLFVAELDGQIVGCVILEVYSRKLAEVRSLCVLPTVQGTGIGRLLVNACVELARERNILEVMAITSADGFFKSCGFDYTPTGEKKALFIQTRDEG